MAFDRVVLPASTPRTRKLFHQPDNIATCSATVLAVVDNYVVLDQSLFYAESGGQDFDTGFIDDRPVLDVQDQSGRQILGGKSRVPIPSIMVDTIIVHKLAPPVDFQPGQTVQLRLDTRRRANLCKSHSAAHFLYQAARDILGSQDAPLLLKGCHITEHEFRFDFADDISKEQVEAVHGKALAMIARGGPIAMLPSEPSDEIFYWAWEDVLIPCGGTHVEDATDVPTFSVSRSKKGKGVTRVRGIIAPVDT